MMDFQHTLSQIPALNDRKSRIPIEFWECMGPSLEVDPPILGDADAHHVPLILADA